MTAVTNATFQSASAASTDAFRCPSLLQPHRPHQRPPGSVVVLDGWQVVHIETPTLGDGFKLLVARRQATDRVAVHFQCVAVVIALDQVVADAA